MRATKGVSFCAIQGVHQIVVTCTTSDPVSWQANEAHLPLSDLFTLKTRKLDDGTTCEYHN